MKFNKVTASHGGNSGAPGVEPDNPMARPIVVGVVVLFVFLVVLWFAAKELLFFTGKEIQTEDLAARDAIILEHRAQEDASLNDYDVVDADKKIYKIPIENAMELLVKRNSSEPVVK